MKENKHLLDAFFALLRAGLWGRTPDPALFVDIGRKEWGALLQMAQKQAVLGLVYAGISRLPKEQMPESQLLLRLYGLVEQIRKQNMRIDEVTQEICSWLESEGLEPIVLKGRTVGAFYAEPNIRQSGDIDLFFHRDFERVVPVIQQHGVEVDLCKRHDKFQHKGIHIESHPEPFTVMRRVDLDFSPIWQEEKGMRMRVLNIRANAMLLLMHPALHFMECGLGFRQMCDWAAFVHYYAGRKELDEAWELVQKQGAGRFAIEFTALAADLLGLDLSAHPQWTISSKEKMRQRMLQELLRQGNFGDWRLPRKWDIRGWIKYSFQKVYYALKTYPYCPIWFWHRVPERTWGMFRREGKKWMGMNKK